MNTLKLMALENALLYWEQTNMLGEFMFVVKNNNLLDSGKKFRPLAGSEMDSHGVLGRKIPNYELLRSDLKKGYFDPLQYLPRIPTEQRENVVSVEQVLNEACYYMLMLPSQLSSWLSTKKVCRVTQEADIPQVTSRNYLHLLPYDNFLLQLDDPFSYGMKDSSGLDINYSFSSFIISRKDSVITVYAIANELSHCLMSSEERRMMLEATSAASKHKKKSFYDLFKKLDRAFQLDDRPHFSFIKFDIDIRTPFFEGDAQTKISSKLGDAVLWLGKKIFGKKMTMLIENDPSLNEIRQFEKSMYNIFPKFLNGFCKCLLEAAPEGTSSKVLISTDPNPVKKRNTSVSDPNDLDWNEVPIGTVIDLLIDKTGKVELINKNINGSEKSYHVRAGHYRKYPQPGGTIKSVWIQSTKVRPDKAPEYGGKTGSGAKVVR